MQVCGLKFGEFCVDIYVNWFFKLVFFHLLIVVICRLGILNVNYNIWGIAWGLRW